MRRKRSSCSLLLCLCYQQSDLYNSAVVPRWRRNGPDQCVYDLDATKAKPGPGRPPVHRKPGPKSRSCSSTARFIHLDRLAIDIRGKNGKVMNRAEIIRALIDGLIDSGMDVTGSASEADLRARVARRLGTPYR